LIIVANWGIPLAAINDMMTKDESFISGRMTLGDYCFSSNMI
jgi:hypothetical protein